MSDFAYLVGGSHDCLKLSIDKAPPVLEMMKRLHPEIGNTCFTVSNRPVLAVIERYQQTYKTLDGSYVYEFVDS